MIVQHKYFVESGIVEELALKGILLEPARVFKYIYFSLPCSNSQDEVLRIKCGEQKHILDYKLRNKITGGWTKYETQVSDPEQTQLLLKQLGISVRAVLTKKFQSWKNDFLILDLVNVNNLFTVLEAKFSVDDVERATNFTRGIGLDPEQSDPRSSIDIFLNFDTRSN